MEEVKVVVAHHECATLRVGDVFLPIYDQSMTAGTFLAKPARRYLVLGCSR